MAEQSSKKQLLNPLKIHQLFRFSTATDKFLIIFGTLAAIVAACGLPVAIILFGELADSFVYFSIAKQQKDSNLSYAEYYDTNEFMNDVKKFGMGSIMIGIIQLVFCYLMMISISSSAKSQVSRIKLLYFKSILRQDMAWFDTYHEDLTVQAGQSLSKMEDAIGQKAALLLFFVFECLLSLITALYYGWKLTLVILSLVPILLIFSYFFNKIQSRFASRETAAYSKAAILAEEALSSIRTVVAYGGENTMVAWYKEKLKFARRAGINKGLINALSQAFVWAFEYSSYSLAFWYGVELIIESNENQTYEYEPGTLLVVYFCTIMGTIALNQALPYWDGINSAKVYMGPIYSIIERESLVDSLSTAGIKPTEFKGSIELRNVSFRYPARPDVQILNKVSLKFPPGEKVALVGSSGCGKSTIMHLIERFYDPDEGEVLIDGYNLRELNLQWVRQHIGCVTQEPVLFATSIKENIGLGTDVSDNAIMEAIELANALDFVLKLPQKQSTVVGERGSFLSGGQKQKIALARAFITQPKVLLLDEATSALDGASEALVQSALDKTGKDRTTLVIAHRLKTVKNCDRIIVLDRGNVIEMGTHNELMKAKGFYFSLVFSQMVDIDDVEDAGLDSELESQRLKTLLSSTKTKKVSILTEELDLSDCIDTSEAKSPILLRILKLNKHEWLQLLIGACAALGLGFTIPCYALLFGEIMGVLSETDPDKARANVNLYAVLFLVVAVWAGICVFLQLYMFNIAGESLTMKLRYMTMVAMLQQEISWFDNPDNTVGALCTRLSLDASNVQGATGVGFGILLQAFGSLGISFIVALILQWKQALVSSLVIPFICLATFFEAKFVSSDILSEIKHEEYSAHIAIEAVSNIKTIASLGVEDYFYKRYEDSLKKSHNQNSRQHLRGLLFGFAVAMESWSYALSLWYGGHLIKEEDVDYEDVFKVGELIIFGALMVGQSIAFAPNYSKGLVSAARIFNILDRKPKINFNRESKDTPDLDNSKIEFQHIKFSYPTRPSRVLREFSCEIKHGQTVALIGSSGCGKSTCIQLLERFYDANDGAVLYADHNVKDLNLEWLRSQLGLVPQEPVLFATTITNNIAFGDNGRVVDKQEIVEAAKKANIHTFISNLPKGYDTELGRKGTQLSGGQKQRIAIARALLRNPKVLLLDEATSALDAENEKVVQAALDVAMVDRTCIVIAHRLITIQDADKIIVVHSGQVVEEGTHQQLMAKKGVYYQMILLSSAM